MYCTQTGLPFSESMLTWEPKVFPEWQKYAKYEPWFETVMNSSGFMNETIKQKDPSDKVLPEFELAARRALPYYNKLNSVRSVPKV